MRIRIAAAVAVTACLGVPSAMAQMAAPSSSLKVAHPTPGTRTVGVSRLVVPCAHPTGIVNQVWFEEKRPGQSWHRYEPAGIKRSPLMESREGSQVILTRTVSANALSPGFMDFNPVSVRIVSLVAVRCGQTYREYRTGPEVTYRTVKVGVGKIMGVHPHK